jgi:DNA polymerase-3 subunit alpha
VPIADFVHLKVRSAYSLTEGANKVDKVVALAKDNDMPAVAVTDRNNLFGALEFSQYAAKAGIQPIVGCDLAIRREEEGGIATAGKLPTTDWLTVLVQSETGLSQPDAAGEPRPSRVQDRLDRSPAARRSGRIHGRPAGLHR